MKKIALLSLLLLAFSNRCAVGWGDDGHKTVALIAQRCLTPATKRHITAMLRSDTDDTTKHDIASAATWADNIAISTIANYTTNILRIGTS